MPDQTPELDVEAIRARLDAALAHIRECMHIGLQDAKLYDEAGRKRIGEWADFIDKQIHAAVPAPEMPRPPAEEAPTEYMVVVPSIIGSLEDWRTDYRTDGVRKSTRDEAIAHGLEAEGHDDWLIAIVVGDKLTGLAWQHEDRDDAEEIAEAAEALGLAVPEAANGTAQSPSSSPETPGTGSGRGTGVAEADGAQAELSLIPADLITSDPGIRGGEPCITGTRIPAHEVAGYLADGATWDEVREMLPSLPSLPVPSTADYRHEPEGTTDV